MGELACNFRWQLGLAGLASPLLLGLARCPRSAAAGVVLALTHLLPALWLRLPIERRELAPDAARVRVATANLAFGNWNHPPLLEWLRAEALDLVAVQEATPGWRLALASLGDLYPHRVFLPLRPDAPQDAFGVGLLSRFPIRDARFESPGDRRRPWLECRVELGGRELQIVVVHPTRPGRVGEIERRDRGLLGVVGGVEWTDCAVLLGDLNASSFSPVFDELLSGTGLADSRAGFGRLPTWPTSRPALARIDLDHVLVGAGISVLERGVGPPFGSDHLPATATLVLGSGSGTRR